jgi:PhnB protein
MQLHPHLSFNGDCEEAFKWYEHVFGAAILSIIRPRGTPMEAQIPPDKLVDRYGTPWMILCERGM